MNTSLEPKNPVKEEVFQTIPQLFDPETRYPAIDRLLRLKKENPHIDVEGYVWNSAGIPALIISEITATQSLLFDPILVPEIAIRTISFYNLLALIAKRTYSLKEFMRCQIVTFLFPIMNCTRNEPLISAIRLGAWNVLAALFEHDDVNITMALTRQFWHLILIELTRSTMYFSEPLVALHILRKIVSTPEGVAFVTSRDNIDALSTALRATISHVGVRCQRYLLISKEESINRHVSIHTPPHRIDEVIIAGGSDILNIKKPLDECSVLSVKHVVKILTVVIANLKEQRKDTFTFLAIVNFFMNDAMFSTVRPLLGQDMIKDMNTLMEMQ